VLLKLLSLPVALPAAGIRYCLEKVLEMAEAELYDEAPIREQLLLLQLELEEGRLSEADYRSREAELLTRLREVRAAQRERSPQSGEGAEPGRGEVIIEMPDELRGP
jgi:hypothetical protein